MRDIVLALLMVGLLPVALFRPHIGACLWAWVSIMNPHTLTYGFARGLPWAQATAVATLLGLVFAGKRRHTVPWSFGTGLLYMLMIWMTVTSVFSINVATEVWDRWAFVMKIFVMLVVSLALIRGRRQIELLMWVIVGSVAFYGVKGGLFTLLTGGGGRVWGPPGGMIADNNSIAIAFIIVLPWMYYLQAIANNRWVKWGMGLSMALTVFALLGTQSRGALVALLVMGLLLGLKGKHAVRSLVGVGILIALAIAFMPDAWVARMNTIGGYNADSSAMSRLWTWQTLWNLAVDRPLVGGGFRSDSVTVFTLYSPVQGRGEFSQDVFVAHSIYFQALGEHGFPGLFLYLGIGFWTWWAAGNLGRKLAKHPEYGSWVPLLMRMCQVSLAGFAVGGAFLSLMILDLPYYIFAVVLLVRASTLASVPSAKPLTTIQPHPA